MQGSHLCHLLSLGKWKGQKGTVELSSNIVESANKIKKEVSFKRIDANITEVQICFDFCFLSFFVHFISNQVPWLSLVCNKPVYYELKGLHDPSA